MDEALIAPLSGYRDFELIDMRRSPRIGRSLGFFKSSIFWPRLKMLVRKIGPNNFPSFKRRRGT